jgi:hypothetical protein
MGMKATLVAITILQCNDSSMAMSVKENLKTDLSRAIEEMNRVLTTTSRPTQAITMPRVISVEKPSEDLDCECMAHHTDCYAQALGVVDIGSLLVELSWRIRVRSGRPSCRASQGQNHGVWRGYRGSGEVR